jgi:hypothetical protein
VPPATSRPPQHSPRPQGSAIQLFADIEPRRRATTAKRLRKAGMFFGAIAYRLER